MKKYFIINSCLPAVKPGQLLLLLTILLVVASPAFSQDYKKDFAAANRFLYQSKKLSFRADVKVYRSATDKGELTSTGYKKIKGGTRYEKAFSTEKLITKNSFLLVDHNSKTIITGKNIKTQKAEPLPDTLKYDNGDSIVFNKKENGKLYYTVYNRYHPSVLRTEITLSAKNLAIVQIDYYYDTSLAIADPAYRLSVTYDYAPQEKELKNVFDFSHYIKKNDDKYEATEKYKGYKVIKM